MPNYIAASTLVLLLAMVATRVLMLRRSDTKAIHFGRLDKTDFLIPPFALFYIYTIFAAAFGLPLASTQRFFNSNVLAWIGVFFCIASLVMMALSLIAFGRSFRIGIDVDNPDRLITSGIFAISRNPIYVAFAFILIGQFLAFPNWILLVFLVGGIWLIHRQVLREEAFLQQHYGQEYSAYRQRVRRYI